MFNEKIKNAIHDYMEEIETADIIKIIREINSYNGSLDSFTWYDMEEFDELCSGMSAWEIARDVCYGNFCAAHDYFHWDGLGHLESCDYVNLDDSDIEEIIEELEIIPFKYIPDEIKEIIEEVEEEERAEDEEE